MSRRDDQYDDQYNGYNDAYTGGNRDTYGGDYQDGYGGGFREGNAGTGNGNAGYDQGYTDQYGNRYGGDTDQTYGDDGGYVDQNGQYNSQNNRYSSGRGGYDGRDSQYDGRNAGGEDGYYTNNDGDYSGGRSGYNDSGYEDSGYDDGGYDDDRYGDGYDDGVYEDSYAEDEDVVGGSNHYEGRGSSRKGSSGSGSARRSGTQGGGGGGRAPVSTRVGGGRGNGRGARNGRGGRGGSHKKRRIILLVVEVAVLLIVVAILYAVTRVTKVGKANLSEEDIQDNISETVKTNTAMKGFRNIALFGVDSTEGQLDQRTRSDTIIIASINQDTGDVKLVSVYRDTLLNLSGSTSDSDLTNTDNYNKVNAAYAKGGPELAINVLNTNLDMNITDFVTVGFGGLTDVVNALGGIEINVEQDEISHLNNYQSTMAQELNMNYTEVTEPGLQTLDGLQTTAYCRIRYTRGWDYKRAARQRAVLYAIFNKAKQADPAALTEIANNAFNEIYTSMDLSTLVSDITALANYNIQAEDSIDEMSNGFPQETARIQANLGNALGDCVVPRTLSNNVIWLHQFLFNDSSFQPSQTVQSISDTIDDMTKDAVPEEMTDEDHT